MSHPDAAAGLRSLGSRSFSATPPIPMLPYPWKTRVALPAAIVLAVIAAAGWSARDAVLPATEVLVVPAVLRPIAGTSTHAAATGSGHGGVVAQAAGWIEPDPYAIGVSALADGIVREILVLEGQRVRAGEILARLVDDDAKLAVQRAEADLAAGRAELGAAQRHWDNPVERRRAVAMAKASLEETQAELAKLADDIAAERARVGEWETQVDRLQKAVAGQAAAEQELAVARFRLAAQQAVAKATEARRPMLQALVEQKAADLTAAEANASLRIEEARALEAAKATVMQAQASLDEARLRLSRMEVRSPAAGVVMTLMIEPGGKLIQAMDSPHSAYVARIFDPSRLQVRVDVPLADASKVGVGTQAEITAEALPGRTLRGEVTRVVNEADLTKNTLQFKVRIIDPPEGLKPEMLARVKFITSDRRGSATTAPVLGSGGGAHFAFIPDALVSRGATGPSVLVADRGRGIAVRRDIALADTAHDGWIAIASGVSAGDQLISEPTGIADGTRIRVIGEDHDLAALSIGKAGHDNGVH